MRNEGQNKKTGGFTLIELLIAMILAAIVVTPLLSFMLNIMDTERKERAKATSEQEIQSALDYIAQDLEQAVYIYDADGLNNNSTTTTATSGIKNQIPPIASVPGCGTTTPTCVPVLVFWKREFRQVDIPKQKDTEDTFTYSLVAYYLIKGNNANETWSSAARIGRFQIKDGVKNPTNPIKANGYPNYIEEPSKGFQLFNLRLPGITLNDKMNRWQKTKEDYTAGVNTLVDFIDQSKIKHNCPENTQQVPSIIAGGFYACVDSSTTSAQVYIRGNALARLDNNATYSANNSMYFPTTSIQIKGRGSLSVE